MNDGQEISDIQKKFADALAVGFLVAYLLFCWGDEIIRRTSWSILLLISPRRKKEYIAERDKAQALIRDYIAVFGR